MPYKAAKFTFFFSLIACVGLRIYLKLSLIDPETGFYLAGGDFPILVYNLLLGLSCAAILLAVFLPKKGAERVCAVYSRQARGFAALSGVAALPVAGLCAFAQFEYMAELDFQGSVFFGALLLLLRVVCLAAAPVVSAFLLLYVGAKAKTDSRDFCMNGVLLLVPLVWQVANLLSSYMSYTAIRSVSDQRLTVVMLIFLVPCLLAWARVLGGVNPEKGMRQFTAFGLMFSLAALSVSAGVLAAAFFDQTVSIAMAPMDAFFYLAFGLYTATLCLTTRAEAA